MIKGSGLLSVFIGEEEKERGGTNDLFGGGVDDGDTFLLDRFSPLAIDEKLTTRHWDRHFSLLHCFSLPLSLCSDY